MAVNGKQNQGVTHGVTQSKFRVTVTIEGNDWGVWDKRTGGRLASNTTTYSPGGLAPQVTLVGNQTVDAVQLQRIYDLPRDHDNLQELFEADRRRTKCVVKQIPLDNDGNAWGGRGAIVWNRDRVRRHRGRARLRIEQPRDARHHDHAEREPDRLMSGRSILEQLREKRRRGSREDDRPPEPRARGSVVARYRLLDPLGEGKEIGERILAAVHRRRNARAGLLFIDTLIAACVGLYLRTEKAGSSRSTPTGTGPASYDSRLADALGIEASIAREVLMALFDDNKVGVMRAHALALMPVDDRPATFRLGEALGRDEIEAAAHVSLAGIDPMRFLTATDPLESA
jgi:hypothetical protein